MSAPKYNTPDPSDVKIKIRDGHSLLAWWLPHGQYKWDGATKGIQSLLLLNENPSDDCDLEVDPEIDAVREALSFPNGYSPDGIPMVVTHVWEDGLWWSYVAVPTNRLDEAIRAIEAAKADFCSDED